MRRVKSRTSRVHTHPQNYPFPAPSSSPSAPLFLLLLSLFFPTPTTAAAAGVLNNRGILIAGRRREYSPPPAVSTRNLHRGRADEFRFGRFQSLSAVKRVFDECRSPGSFKPHRGKDGRVGSVCSTRLGGDWVLAESEQIAPSCTCEEVLRVYLDGQIQKRWSADKVIEVKVSSNGGRLGRGDEPYYRQDLLLHSQRVIRSRTGVMQYSQRIRVDKIGAENYCAFVQLDAHEASTVKKPFNSLSVYVGLQQEGENVKIYAAGVFEVNRKVVPNLVVFDASGIAGDMAGKGTLWLSGHFEDMKMRHNARSSTARGIGVGLVHGMMHRFNTKLHIANPTVDVQQ